MQEGLFEKTAGYMIPLLQPHAAAADIDIAA
jgi:hypothetical protein